jgi:hypothetical protein
MRAAVRLPVLAAPPEPRCRLHGVTERGAHQAELQTAATKALLATLPLRDHDVDMVEVAPARHVERVVSDP